MVKIKIALLSIFWSLMLYSCKEVSFSETQPIGVKPLSEIPAQLKGKYLILNKATGAKNDSLIIESWGYHLKDKDDKDWLGKGVVSDSLVVKFYKDYYFVNFRSGNQWVLRLIKIKPSGDLEFLSIDVQDDAKRKGLLKKLSNRFNLKEVKKGKILFYQINPTTNQLMQLINEGYFTGSTFKRIN